MFTYAWYYGSLCVGVFTVDSSFIKTKKSDVFKIFFMTVHRLRIDIKYQRGICHIFRSF